MKAHEPLCCVRFALGGQTHQSNHKLQKQPWLLSMQSSAPPHRQRNNTETNLRRLELGSKWKLSSTSARIGVWYMYASTGPNRVGSSDARFQLASVKSSQIIAMMSVPTSFPGSSLFLEDRGPWEQGCEWPWSNSYSKRSTFTYLRTTITQRRWNERK